jgi:hypothetical protein
MGQQCTFSSECCGGAACVPDVTGVLKCTSGCQAAAAPCTSTADCCSGLACKLSPGASVGTCTSYVPPQGGASGGGGGGT